MTLEPSTVRLLRTLDELAVPPLHTLTPAEARISNRRETPPGPVMFSEQSEEISGLDGVVVPIKILRPTRDSRGPLVYFHGGGWMLGSAELSTPLGRHLAAETNCTVVLVDYRKAPEHPFPAATDDAWAAILWVAERADELSSAPSLIVVGDSAGGNIAALATIRARDAAGPKIAAQALVYPITDADLDRPSYLEDINQIILRRETMAWFWNHYHPDVTCRNRPEVTPLNTPELAGLPPTLVITAEHDVLRDEGEAFARRLMEAQVPVTAVRHLGQTHGFFSMIGVLDGWSDALGTVASFIRRVAS